MSLVLCLNSNKLQTVCDIITLLFHFTQFPLKLKFWTISMDCLFHPFCFKFSGERIALKPTQLCGLRLGNASKNRLFRAKSLLIILFSHKLFRDGFIYRQMVLFNDISSFPNEVSEKVCFIKLGSCIFLCC